MMWRTVTHHGKIKNDHNGHFLFFGRGDSCLNTQQEKPIKTRGDKNSIFMIFLIVYYRIRSHGTFYAPAARKTIMVLLR